MATIKDPKDMTVKELNQHFFYHFDTLGKVQKEVNKRLREGETAIKAMIELDKLKSEVSSCSEYEDVIAKWKG